MTTIDPVAGAPAPALEERMARLEALVLEQQAEIERLRSREPASDARASAPAQGSASGSGAADSMTDRRSLLRHAGGLVAGTVAASAAVVATAGPAAAASGSFDGNPAVLATGTGGSGSWALSAESVYGNAVNAETYQTDSGIAVRAKSTGPNSTGVVAEGSKAGVTARSSGEGVALEAVHADFETAIKTQGRIVVSGPAVGSAIEAKSLGDGGVGVFGQGRSTGVWGEIFVPAAGTGTGVFGQATGMGLTDGKGVHGHAAGFFGVGVYGDGPTGVRGMSESASGIGVHAIHSMEGQEALRVNGRATLVTAGNNAAFDITNGHVDNGAIGLRVQTSAPAGGEAVVATGLGPTTTGVNAAGATGVKATANMNNGVAVRAQAQLPGSTGGDFVGTKYGLQTAGNLAPMRLIPSTSVATAPTTGAHAVGELFCDTAGGFWACVVAGTPGKWRALSGPNAAGSLFLLPTPKRIYDSRNGTNPTNVTKGRLNDKQSRAINANVPGETALVPAAATAILVNATVTGTNPGGFLALYKNGIPYPGTSTVNWSVQNTTTSNGAIVAVDATLNLRAYMEGVGGTDFLIDVIGYYA